MATTKLLADFCTVTPVWRTSAGSRPSAWLTRFCTSTAAMSGSRDTSNVTVIWLAPLLVLDEAMYCMPSTPLIACSSGVVTAVSTVSALAPVYTAVTATVGGATSGYCAMGIDGMASAPARTMTSEHTDARIGRLMNVSTNMGSARLDRRAVADLLEVGDDDALAGVETAADDIVVADDLAQPHRLLPRDHALLAGFGDEDEILTGDPVDGDQRHDQRRLAAPDDARAHVLENAQRL